MVKLHTVAALTPERLKNEPELAATLSKTPTDMMDLSNKSPCPQVISLTWGLVSGRRFLLTH